MRDKADSLIKRLVTYYKDNAPFRFLTPWVPKEYSPSRAYFPIDRKVLGNESIMFAASAPYVIFKDIDQWKIKINPVWVSYYGQKQDDLIRVVIDCLAFYIAHRNELSKDSCISFLVSTILEGHIVPAPQKNLIVDNNTVSPFNLPKDNEMGKGVEPRPILKSESFESSIKHDEITTPKPFSPSENVIIGGKLLSIGDREVLSKVGPLVESNKLDAVKYLIDHFSGHKDLNMTFKDWALLIETVPIIENSSIPLQNVVFTSAASHKDMKIKPISSPKTTKKETVKAENRRKSATNDWDEVDRAIIGIESIHDVFGSQEDFPSFVIGSLRLDGSVLLLSIKAWSGKTDKRYLVNLLFSEVTYYRASMYMNDEQSFRIACKKGNNGFKYRIGNGNIYINSSKARVLSINEI